MIPEKCPPWSSRSHTGIAALPECREAPLSADSYAGTSSGRKQREREESAIEEITSMIQPKFYWTVLVIENQSHKRGFSQLELGGQFMELKLGRIVLAEKPWTSEKHPSIRIVARCRLLKLTSVLQLDERKYLILRKGKFTLWKSMCLKMKALIHRRHTSSLCKYELCN